MGMDFNVNVNVKTNGAEKIDALEAKIKSLKTQPINLKVNVDSKSLNVTNLGSQLQSSFASAGTSAGKAYNTALQTQINAMAKTQQTAFTAPLKNMSKYEKSYSDMWNKIMSKAPANYGKNQQQIANDKYFAQVEQMAQKASEIQKKVSQKFLDVESSGVKKTLTKYAGVDSSEYKALESSYTKLISLQKELKTGVSDDGLGKTLSNKEMVSKYEQFYDVLAKCKNEMKLLSNETTSLTKPFNQLDATIAGNKTLTWLKNNSKAAKDYGEALTNLAEKQKNTTNADELKEYTKQVNKIKTEAAAAGKTGNSFLADTKRAFGQIFQFTTVYGTLQRIPQVLNQMTNAVIEIDTAMTNLKKVTDETDARYSEFLTNASQNAKSLGRDVSSYITQTSEWAKLGYSMNSSSELAKVSSIYANVGEVDDKTAVSDLVTVMKAYNMQDYQAMDIADMLNELGNNYATSAGDLGAGLTKMASTMSMSNVSLEKSLAILTGGTEITQNAEELGNAIKVSVLRMRGQKGALEDIGENADDIESVSKMQTQILNMTKGAVNIMDSADPTKFRDYYDVMADIAEVLPKLNETDQANLIETLFGKNRANQGQAILQAFQSGQIQKAYQTALNSAGSAQKEQDRWMQSAEAKIQQFKAQFQDLSSSAINSDFLKGAIDAGTKLLEILTQIIDVGGGIPAVLGAIGGVALFKNLD